MLANQWCNKCLFFFFFYSMYVLWKRLSNKVNMCYIKKNVPKFKKFSLPLFPVPLFYLFSSWSVHKKSHEQKKENFFFQKLTPNQNQTKTYTWSELRKKSWENNEKTSFSLLACVFYLFFLLILILILYPVDRCSQSAMCKQGW